MAGKLEWQSAREKCWEFGTDLAVVESEAANLVVASKLKSLILERCGRNFRSVFFKLILQIVISSTSSEIPQNPFDDKPALVQVMAYCRHETSNYRN